MVGARGGRTDARLRWRRMRVRTDSWVIAAILRSEPRQPLVLQAVPPGQWLAVFTVGKRAFTAALPPAGHIAAESQQRWTAVTLPPHVQERCSRLARALQLDFAQVHVVLTASGEA